MVYTKIKSVFIQEELKRTSWKNREYIEALMKIEGLAQAKTFGMFTGYMINGLRENYPKQWKKIHLELNPKGYKKSIEFEKKEAEKERKEDERLRKVELLELKREKEAWKKMGGK